MNYFPNGEEEKNLIKFIAKYQYLKVSNVKYFFTSKKYYRNRVNNLISKRFLRKVKLNLVLDELGIEYARLFNFEYNKMNRDTKYLPRLFFLSDFAAYYNDSDTVIFTPSFAMKEKERYTVIARRFIGILNINGIEYLTYNISNENDNRYVKAVMYEIQKEKEYRNIIILVNDINRINIDDFAFGLNNVLVIEDNEKNRESLKYLNSINWSNIIQKHYNNKVYISEYSFCDYTNNKNKFVSLFYYLDTEKLNRIKHFLRENGQKNVDIICNNEVFEQIKKELPNAHYIVVNLEEYIDKERIIYD